MNPSTIKKKTQFQIILAYLQDLNDWKREYEIRCMNTPYGWIGARGDRDVRQLVKDGKLLANWDGKYRIVKYKSIDDDVDAWNKAMAEITDRGIAERLNNGFITQDELFKD